MGTKGHPGKNHHPFQYPPELWITLRSLYESGQFATLKQVYDHLKRMQSGIKLPSFQYVKQKAAEEGWNKHSSDAEIAEKKAQSIEDMFEEYGMPLKERIRRNVMGITTIDQTVNEIAGLLKTAKVKVEKEGVTPEVAESLKTVMDSFPKMTQGMKIMLEYLKNSHALCGDNAPEKKQIFGDGVKKNTRDLEDLSEEELDREAERIFRNRKG